MTRRTIIAIAAAAGLCVVGAALLIFGWYSSKPSEERIREQVESSRSYFEASFRDDEAQRESYGDLEGTRWSGYYVSDPPQPTFTHLVVNANGGFYVYRNDFYERRGVAKPDAADAALLAGYPVYLGNNQTRTRVELRDAGEGRLVMRWQEGNTTEVTFVKKAPPRFARPPSPDDKVRFIGVFSGTRAQDARNVHLAQVWLWASEGRVWAVWLGGNFSNEREQPVSGNIRADVTCEDEACTSLVVDEGGGQKLKRESPDKLVWIESPKQTLDLVRGEIVRGLPWKYAPLSTMEENRKWLRSLHPDVTWKAPGGAG